MAREKQRLVKLYICSRCGKYLRYDDMVAAVDHMLVKHGVKNSDDAKRILQNCDTTSMFNPE